MDISLHTKAAMIIDHYGARLQLIKLCEELGELQAEAARLALEMQGVSAKGDEANFFEEVADVILLITQLTEFYDVEKQVRGIMDAKADRTLARIEKERGCMKKTYKDADTGDVTIEFIDLKERGNNDSRTD